MKPLVSIIMGSTSDLPVMEGAAKILDEIYKKEREFMEGISDEITAAMKKSIHPK